MSANPGENDPSSATVISVARRISLLAAVTSLGLVQTELRSDGNVFRSFRELCRAEGFQDPEQ